MKLFISKVRLHIAKDRMLVVAVLILSGVLVAGVVSASTTISTDINTQGQLTVTGTSTLTGSVSIGNTGTASTLSVFGQILGNAFAASSTTATSTFAGYVGIGTTTPNMKLSLWGSGTNGFFGISSTTQGDIFVVNTSGKVGIGTTSPTTVLTVQAASTAGGIQSNGTAALGSSSGGGLVAATVFAPDAADERIGGLYFAGSNGSGGYNYPVTINAFSNQAWSGGSVSGAYLAFSTTYSGSRLEKMRITGDGLVGIGTTTPTTQLQVTASTNATTTVTIGKVGTGKGSCLELYDAAGTAVYAYVAAGATTFSLSATSCK